MILKTCDRATNESFSFKQGDAQLMGMYAQEREAFLDTLHQCIAVNPGWEAPLTKTLRYYMDVVESCEKGDFVRDNSVGLD